MIEEFLEVLLNLMMFSFTVIMIVAMLPKFEKIKISLKQRITLLRAPYYREIPCDGDWSKILYIAYTTNILRRKTDFIGAIFLKWIKDGSISIFKDKKTYIIFNVSPENFSGDTYEHKLFSTLYEYAESFCMEKIIKKIHEKNLKNQTTNVVVLESKRLKRWCKRNRDILFDGMEKILQTWQGKFVNSKVLNRVRKSRIIKIYHIFPTEKFLEDAIKIAGLKKYLKSYTLIKEREAIEVKLFEDYLIFAQIVGDASRVIQEFKVFYPAIIEKSLYGNSNDIRLIRNTLRSSIVSAKVSKSIDRICGFNNRGFSAGGGGRGSFGGGSKGGGGFR